MLYLQGGMKKLSPQRMPRKELDKQLDRVEARLSELVVLYEQFFVDILPQPPTKIHKEVVSTLRQLLKAPFKNSQSRFRLRNIIHRYQTYNTYWERVNKQREEGTYCKDLFKAEMRQRMMEDAKLAASRVGAAEQGLRDLYSSYESAMKKVGGNTNNINFNSFKKTLISKAKDLKKEHGVSKLHYKIVVRGDKVVIKASAK